MGGSTVVDTVGMKKNQPGQWKYTPNIFLDSIILWNGWPKKDEPKNISFPLIYGTANQNAPGRSIRYLPTTLNEV